MARAATSAAGLPSRSSVSRGMPWMASASAAQSCQPSAGRIRWLSPRRLEDPGDLDREAVLAEGRGLEVEEDRERHARASAQQHRPGVEADAEERIGLSGRRSRPPWYFAWRCSWFAVT
jgi:hypothetical protein